MALHPIKSRIKINNWSSYSVPLFNKEGLGEILLDKSPSAPSLCSPPFFKGGGEYLLIGCITNAIHGDWIPAVHAGMTTCVDTYAPIQDASYALAPYYL